MGMITVVTSITVVQKFAKTKMWIPFHPKTQKAPGNLPT